MPVRVPHPPLAPGWALPETPVDVWSPLGTQGASSPVLGTIPRVVDPMNVPEVATQANQNAAALLDFLYGGRKMMTERELLHNMMGAEY